MIFEQPKIGDKVRLTSHKEASLGYGYVDSGLAGQECIVVGVTGGQQDWRITVRVLALCKFAYLDSLHTTWEMLERDCKESWRKSPDELRKERYDQFVSKALAHDTSHQGFTNPATYLAYLYLNNDKDFSTWVKRNVRKNGTVNPSKVEKYFGARHKVDSWAFECPIGVPAEFNRCVIQGLRAKMSVKWGEVANMFTLEEV